MANQGMANHKIFDMAIGEVYPHYVTKAERRGRSSTDVDAVICWLTGYSPAGLASAVANGTTFREFFATAPQLHPDRVNITGKICGVSVEDIEDPLMQNIRYMDKIVDMLSKTRNADRLITKFSG